MKLLWLAVPAFCLVPLAGASAQVGGSYRQSCTNIEQDGPTLSADCKAPGGRRISSSIDVSRCRGQGVSNTYGRLTCGGVEGSTQNDSRGYRRGGDEGDNGDNGYVRRRRFGGGYDGGGYRPDDNDNNGGYAPRRRFRAPDPDDE